MSTDTPEGGESSADIDALYGNQMSEADCKAFLAEQGSGVLSLAHDGEAYGIPISFGFDGERTLFFIMVGFRDPSRKRTFADETETASFLAYDGSSREEWRSVIARGALELVPESEFETAEPHIDDNAWFPDVVSMAEPMGGVEVWCLHVAEFSGLRGGA